jgi:hypothetical protein
MNADKKTALLLMLVAGPLSFTSGFDFPDFNLSRGGLFLGNNAHREKNGVLRLTEATSFQIGIVWVPVKQEVRDGFETTFTFRISDASGQYGGGDGLAFIVQNDGQRAVGGWGASGGFLRSDQGARGGFERGIRRMAAVFFDTYQNDWDNGNNHVRIYTCGEVWNLKCNGPAGNGIVPGAEGQASNGFLSAKSAAGALIVKTLNGKLWFSVNGRTGEGFKDNEGFFEFDVKIGAQ